MRQITGILILLTFFKGYSQEITKEQYISTYKDIAIQKMISHKIPASITLAQGLLESASGNSELAMFANNHFGIKCHNNDWDGETYLKDDDKKNECFRKYKNPAESYEDHSLFLTSRSRYAALFELKITDYKSWAHGLKNAGYATNPKYADLLIKLIEDNQLYLYDQMTLGQVASTQNDSIIPENPEPFDNSTEISLGESRKIFLKNGIKCTLAKEEDTFFKIANAFDMMGWQIYKYNDLKKTDVLKEGQLLYLQPKKRKGTAEYHIAMQGDTMHSISQLYGIKLKHLYRKNRMERDEQPVPGQKIYLQKNKPL